ncbi:MAG TPA: hypothetical protein DET40_11285 [Lentisphaeria bacterium]|nr:MAG: hypothetical protein A2X45_19905 [Lentisphaerae bacterium GWF2_50_93]HCE44122.1 hypothetical protein [Lentisphaeria bacterium]
MNMKTSISVFVILFSACLHAENKIDRIYVLTPDWIVAVNDYMDDTDQLIYSDNKAEFDKILPEIEKMEKDEKPNWVAIKRRARMWQNGYEKFSKQHALMSDPKFFSVLSEDDAKFAKPQNPVRSIHWVNSLGDRKHREASPLRGCFNYEVGHYAYLNLPSPLQNGKKYTIKQDDGRSGTFVFDDRKTVNRSIKVNQAGYLSDAPQKFAYLGAWVPSVGAVDFSKYPEFRILKTDDLSEAFTGKIVLRAKDEKKWGYKASQSYSGEDVYEMDFSGFKTPGKYIIYIPGLGRSWDFEIGKNAVGAAFYTAMRGMYHQRCGCALDGKYTAWTRGLCHPPPVYGCKLLGGGGQWFLDSGEKAAKNSNNFDFEIIRQTADLSQKFDIWGGWHDAADYDRGEYHHRPVWDMLGLYEINPRAFIDGQLNIPESGNGIPDILDEAKYGIDIWKRSQDKDGGVSGRIETTQHPGKRQMPEFEKLNFCRSIPTRQSTMFYAASAATFARIIKDFDRKMSDEYYNSALAAYKWAMNPANSREKTELTIDMKDEKTKKEEKVKLIYKGKDERVCFAGLQAAVNFYLVSNDPAFLKDAEEKFAPDSIRYFKSWPNYLIVQWGLFEYAWLDLKGAREGLREQARKELISFADQELEPQKNSPYRNFWFDGKSRSWGSGVPSTWAKYAILAYFLTKDDKYKNSALLNLDFQMGCNPLGMVQTTGIGQVFPCEIQDMESRSDGIDEPVPGITTYGIVDVPYGVRGNVYSMEIFSVDNDKESHKLYFLPEGFKVDKPEIPMWRQLGPHSSINPECNEFTIHETMGQTVLMLGAFLGEGWTPDKALKERKPKKYGELEGFFWLP